MHVMSDQNKSLSKSINMESTFWNERYRSEEYAYGKEPNDFLVKQFSQIGKKVLCLAEGEGRNAVFLAKNSCKVTCIDYAEEGLHKAQQLAKENGVELTTVCANLFDVNLKEKEWDIIVVIFGHFPSDLRQKVHGQIYSALKPGGTLILEAYRKDQVNYKTGGPMNVDMLYSNEELSQDFKQFDQLEISETVREVYEGAFHHGEAAVIQVVGKKI
jgi:2-polyprenyl-3-methyl-5-hydroxy-6-metoxy-1,4-benzoquinol methylase